MTKKITQKSRDEKDVFISVVSHQLRTPITTIKFITEGLLHGANGISDEHRKKLQSIHDAAERAANLVNDMLSVSRLVAKEVEPVYEVCDLKDNILNTIEMLRSAAAAKNQKISFDMSDDVHMVNICNDYLTRAFQNILDNAVSYGDEDSIIKVGLEETDGHASYLVSVHNFGPAIPSKELPKMFQKFHRVPGAEKIKPSGTGLGLFIAKSAIELNGGKIWIESSKEKGTTIYFTVPFKAPKAK